jgi:hypothetical protein
LIFPKNLSFSSQALCVSRVLIVNIAQSFFKINFNFLLNDINEVPHAVVLVEAMINEVLFEFAAAELRILFGDLCKYLIGV